MLNISTCKDEGLGVDNFLENLAKDTVLKIIPSTIHHFIQETKSMTTEIGSKAMKKLLSASSTASKIQSPVPSSVEYKTRPLPLTHEEQQMVSVRYFSLTLLCNIRFIICSKEMGGLFQSLSECFLTGEIFVH
jgi:hypothetical protein